MRNNLLEPVIQVFVKNGPRYNLLNSAVLEMVEFIRKENIRYIISHLIEQFGAQLEACDYVNTFAALKLKFEQNQVHISIVSPTSHPLRHNDDILSFGRPLMATALRPPSSSSSRSRSALRVYQADQQPSMATVPSDETAQCFRVHGSWNSAVRSCHCQDGTKQMPALLRLGFRPLSLIGCHSGEPGRVWGGRLLPHSIHSGRAAGADPVAAAQGRARP